ncbi:MAG: flagellar protein export ATPase FliI [Hyphomicrobiales bacterium]
MAENATFTRLNTLVDGATPVNLFGRVVGVRGLLVEIAGPLHEMNVGTRLLIESGNQRDGVTKVLCEVVGFEGEIASCLPFSSLEGVRLGCPAKVLARQAVVSPGMHWLGRVVNALGDPVDGKGDLIRGDLPYPLRQNPPPAHTRNRVGEALDMGVRVINTFTTCCLGQRMGIFAGSGVGKSVLLSMLTKNSAADVIIVGLVGERGREVKEFIEDDLGEEGLARAIVVVATSDESALMRRQAAFMTLTMAEYFRDQGKNVLCLMDSVTRFAQAQREIGLAAGEPPTSRGYTPTVFTELPKLLERAGPGTDGNGSITGLFTVLVEGDNHNEPIADAVRGILDGHIVMERAIAERGRYPAVNVLKSVSRSMPDSTPEEFRPLIKKAKNHMATYADMEELIQLGAYRAGTTPAVDNAIELHPAFETFLTQGKGDATSLTEGFQALEAILSN